MLAKSFTVRSFRSHTFTRFASSVNNYIILGDEEVFNGIVNSNGNKVLYFTATWCPPCRKIAPVFESLSNEFKEITFLKVDIDNFPSIAEKYKISGVPTFKFLSGPQLKAEFSGADPVSLRQCLEDISKN